MPVVEMRAQVTSAYPGWKWQRRVEGMAANQIKAIWFRLKGCGKI